MVEIGATHGEEQCREHCRAVMDVDVSVGGFGVGSWRPRWEDDAKRSVRHNNQISGFLAVRYVPKYFYLSTRKVHT